MRHFLRLLGPSIPARLIQGGKAAISPRTLSEARMLITDLICLLACVAGEPSFASGLTLPVFVRDRHVPASIHSSYSPPRLLTAEILL